ncbi:MAG: hypothetical protein ACKO96_23260, partial [Flammeovirgaceae bacterium]
VEIKTRNLNNIDMDDLNEQGKIVEQVVRARVRHTGANLTEQVIIHSYDNDQGQELANERTISRAKLKLI